MRMLRSMLACLAVFALAIIGLAFSSNAEAHGNKPSGAQNGTKVWVCKYVGKPGVNERLKPGKNPIVVSSNATVGIYFKDGQFLSYVLAVQTRQNTGHGNRYTGSLSCPAPQGPPSSSNPPPSSSHVPPSSSSVPPSSSTPPGSSSVPPSSTTPPGSSVVPSSTAKTTLPNTASSVITTKVTQTSSHNSKSHTSVIVHKATPKSTKPVAKTSNLSSTGVRVAEIALVGLFLLSLGVGLALWGRKSGKRT